MSQQVEDRLRSALRAEAEALRLSPDPWQQNRRRVAASASGRRRRVLVATAAAVLAVTTALGAGSLLSGREGSGASPAGGGGGGGADDPFTTEYLLGAPVAAETLTIDGKQTVHTIALSDMTGQGPNLCDRYEQVVVEGATSPNSSSGSGGCTPRDPAADNDGVAFDWLMGTEGSGDIRGVTAAVDARVTRVSIWMDDGAAVRARLYPTGWGETRMFAVTMPRSGPVPQRIIAYGEAGTRVLQAVELRTRFGEGWLPASTTCATPVLVDGSASVGVRTGATEARIDFVDLSGVVRRKCISLGRVVQGLVVDDMLHLVLAPEVTRARLESGDRVVGGDNASPHGESSWSYLALQGRGFVQQSDEIVAFDQSGQVLARTAVSDLN